MKKNNGKKSKIYYCDCNLDGKKKRIAYFMFFGEACFCKKCWPTLNKTDKLIVQVYLDKEGRVLE
jgi:predicted SprT family Zn-dependent metalloprotease